MWFSQAVIVNNTMYISGQIGMDPVKKDLVPGGVEAECRQALANIGAILHAAGGDYKNGFQILQKIFTLESNKIIVRVIWSFMLGS